MTKKIEEIFEHTSDSGVTGTLGIDEDGRLYWNGKAVVTEQRVELAWWVNLSVIIGGLSTLAIAVFTALMYFNNHN